VHSKDGNLLHVLEGPGKDVEWITWHEKGDVLLAGSADNTAWMWSVSDAQTACMQVFAGHEDAVTCGMFAMQGKLAITGSADQAVKIWDPKTGRVNMTFSG
jgi:ribosome assembly protein SQT1